jgi:type I restriction enzyme R subunit
MRDIKNITITPEILKLIADIDEFKGRWKVIEMEEQKRMTDRFASTLVIAASIIAAVRLAREQDKTIARELVDTVRRNTTIDWTVRENVRAHLRVLVKRILRKYGYPPDKQEKATQTVLEQAEVLSSSWVT